MKGKVDKGILDGDQISALFVTVQKNSIFGKPVLFQVGGNDMGEFAAGVADTFADALRPGVFPINAGFMIIAHMACLDNEQDPPHDGSGDRACQWP